jgi:hypothetical protein
VLLTKRLVGEIVDGTAQGHSDTAMVGVANLGNADNLTGQAVVKVTKEDFFGPIVKNYVFNMVTDTTLRSLRVNRKHLDSFRPDVLMYNALPPRGTDTVAKVEADASDPAATVVIDQATSATEQAKVTVSNGGASTVYTVDLDDAISGSDEFEIRGPGLPVEVGAAGRQQVAPCGRIADHHVAERRPAGQREYGEEPGPAGCER